VTDTAKARLLIVDDEAAQMQALCHTLEDNGYETVGCGSGEAALAALRSAPFDLLLADLMMPGMDGIGLLRAALAIDPTLVGIIMTGEGTISSAVEAMRSGALDYILKPFKLSAILPVPSRDRPRTICARRSMSSSGSRRCWWTTWARRYRSSSATGCRTSNARPSA